jgi:hypothetical protein
MRATVAKRLRRMISATTGLTAKESTLVHKSSDRERKDYYTAILEPDCGRHHYQQLKKQYYQERRHA